MGISESLILIGSFNWQLISQPSSQPYSLVRNTLTFQFGQLYLLKLYSLQYQIDLYSWRKHTSCHNIVSVHSVSVNKNNLQLCGESKQMRIITEHLESRLDCVQSLEHEEIIRVITQAIAAFKVLVYKFGFFRVSPKLIGFTKEGVVKVWINSNFSLNTIEEEIVGKGDRIAKEKLQSFMVEQLLAELRVRAADVRRIDEMKEQMGRDGIKDFDQVLRFISREGHAPLEFRAGGLRGSGSYTIVKKVEEEPNIIGTNKTTTPVTNPTPILPHRFLSPARLHSHQSPPARIQPKPFSPKPVHYFPSPQHQRLSSPQPLAKFFHRVKSQQKPVFFKSPHLPLAQTTVPNFRPRPLNHSSPLHFQKTSTASTNMNQTNVLNLNPTYSKFHQIKPIERKHVAYMYNKYKDRARIVSDFGIRAENEGVIVNVDDGSVVTTTSRDQIPDDYVQIVGNP